MEVIQKKRRPKRRSSKFADLIVSFFMGLTLSLLIIGWYTGAQIWPITSGIDRVTTVMNFVNSSKILTGEEVLETVYEDAEQYKPLITKQGSFLGEGEYNGKYFKGTVLIDSGNPPGSCLDSEDTIEGSIVEGKGLSIKGLYEVESPYYLDTNSRYELIQVCDGQAHIGTYAKLVE